MQLALALFLNLAFLQTVLACNIDNADDPSNTPDCYKEYPKKLTAGLRLHGWPNGLELKDKPSEKAKTLVKLGESSHWTDEEVELTGKTSGEWVEVHFLKLQGKRGCEETPPLKQKTQGWIKGLDKNKKPLIWTWLANGLCLKKADLSFWA